MCKPAADPAALCSHSPKGRRDALHCLGAWLMLHRVPDGRQWTKGCAVFVRQAKLAGQAFVFVGGVAIGLLAFEANADVETVVAAKHAQATPAVQRKERKGASSAVPATVRALCPHCAIVAGREIVLFTGNANVELASEIAGHLQCRLGNITVRVPCRTTTGRVRCEVHTAAMWAGVAVF